MLIPKHWSSADGDASDPDGKRYALRIWGWSVSNLTEAADVARRRLADASARIRSGSLGKDPYFYGKTPLREEIIAAVGKDGEAIITRNRYGALVLNTARVPFIDNGFSVITKENADSFDLDAYMQGRNMN